MKKYIKQALKELIKSDKRIIEIELKHKNDYKSDGCKKSIFSKSACHCNFRRIS